MRDKSFSAVNFLAGLLLAFLLVCSDVFAFDRKLFLIVHDQESVADTSKGFIKSTLKQAYKQLDKIPATHRYITKVDSLKELLVKGYKRVDSSIVNDTSHTLKAALLKQIVPKPVDTKSTEIVNSLSIDSKQSIDTLLNSKVMETATTAMQSSAQENAALSYIEAGVSYLHLSKTKEAIVNFEKALHIAEQIHSLEITELAQKGLSDAYSQKADAKNALFYYQQYIQTKDSLLHLQTDKIINELNAKYESEHKQLEIQALKIEGENKKQELKKSEGVVREQKQFIALISVILVLIIVLTVTVYRQYRVKKKNNQMLVFQNKKIEEQKSDLEKSLEVNKHLQELLKEDLERYMQMALRKQMNPHFIFNSLNSIQSFILQNDKLSANIYLSKFSSLMRKVLENSQHHFIALSKEIEVLQLYLELEKQRFDNEFECTFNIDESVDVSTDKIPPLLLQPYIENAIWHGLLHKNGERLLKINLSRQADFLICAVEDNGIGRAAALEIAKTKKHHESLGTKITEKRIDLINSINAKDIGVKYIDLKDEKGMANGTKVEITIPYVGL